MQGHPLGLARCGACRTTTATPARRQPALHLSHRLADARSTTSWKVTSLLAVAVDAKRRGSDDNKDFRCHSRSSTPTRRRSASNPQVHRQQTVGIPVLLLRTPRYSMTVFCSPQKTLPHQMCSTLVTVRAHATPKAHSSRRNTTRTSPPRWALHRLVPQYSSTHLR